MKIFEFSFVSRRFDTGVSGVVRPAVRRVSLEFARYSADLLRNSATHRLTNG